MSPTKDPEPTTNPCLLKGFREYAETVNTPMATFPLPDGHFPRRDAPVIFMSTVRAALRSLLLVMPFLFVFCLPWVDLGIWRQTETASVVLHLMSGLTALLLGALIAMGGRRARAAALHPVVLAFAGIAALTFIQATLNPFDGFDVPRTLHGLVKHGVGGLWHLDVAILAAGYLAVSNRRWRNAYAISALAAMTIAAGLTWAFFNRGANPWIPYDFTGWIGVFALLAASAGFMSDDRRIKIAAVALGLFGLFVGRNATADVAVVVAVVSSAYWIVPASTGQIRRVGLALSAVALVGVPALLAISTGPLESLAVRSIDQVKMRTDGIPSALPLDHVDIDKKAYGTVWSRGWMIKTVASNLLAHPGALAFGRGWGSFPQVQAEEMRSVPGRAFPDRTETASLAFWDPNSKADFHSHNLLVEALLSLGLPGALLTAFALLSPLIFARRRDVPVAAFLTVSVCIVGGMWFLVNTLAPVLALAFASCSRVSPARIRPRMLQVLPMAAGFAVAGLALFFFASILFGVSLAERQARYFEPMDWQIAPPCRAIAGLTAPAREVNVTIFKRFVEEGEQSRVPFAWFAQRAKTALNYACILRDLSDHTADPALLESSLDLRYRLLRASGNFPPIVKMMKVDISYWGDDIRRLLTMASDRTDAIIPYVSWLILKGDRNEALDAMAKLSPLVMPGDPVADWLEARRAELTGDATTHRERMAAALRGGIANLIRLRRADTEIFMKTAAGPAATEGTR